MVPGWFWTICQQMGDNRHVPRPLNPGIRRQPDINIIPEG
jgi:hypothetical protein